MVETHTPERVGGAVAVATLPKRLYHGTGEPIIGELSPGGSDGLLWMTDSPAIAQTYIPDSGLSVLLLLSHRDEEPVVPTPYTIAVAKHLGYGVEATWDQFGRAKSWKWHDAGGATAGFRTGELCEVLERVLGYVPDRSEQNFHRKYAIKFELVDGVERILPADYHAPGEVFVFSPTGGDLRMADWIDGNAREGDLQAPDHLRLGDFRALEEAGYDGVIMPDFCQSETWGNVGHTSWGFFRSGLPKLQLVDSFPATHHDWAETVRGFPPETTAYLEWLARQADSNLGALADRELRTSPSPGR